MRVVVASASSRRRSWYMELLHMEGFHVEATTSGVDCIDRMRAFVPSVLVLETTLRWGGTDGVLAVRADDAALCDIPVVLISAEGVTLEVFKLSKFSIESFYSRIPQGAELVGTLRALTGKRRVGVHS